MPAKIMVQISPPLTGLVNEEQLRETAAYTLSAEHVAESTYLTVVLVDDGEMRRLNLRHRKIDAPTDVLSFQPGTLPPGEAGEEMKGYLGDVIISYPRVVVQAAQHMVSLEQELNLLVVHGVLHLLNYEDETDSGRETMWNRQDSLCQDLIRPSSDETESLPT
ncbi:MAG: rRNA maturation RNase YbeY [Chloroflexi bacterium]|nr:rRNA maturation RNase YbeY [Chloroflexota bacterium]